MYSSTLNWSQLLENDIKTPILSEIFAKEKYVKNKYQQRDHEIKMYLFGRLSLWKTTVLE